jgi:predicted amino acid dehydrogenase/uncharacterized membrane protein
MEQINPETFRDPHSWDLLLPLDSPPKNRRKSNRRQAFTDSNSGNNNLTDRRREDRRGIEVKLPIHSPITVVYEYLRNVDNLPSLFPGMLKLRRLDGDVIENVADLGGTPLRWALKLSFEDSEHSIHFARISGDLECCDGVLAISQMPGSTLVTVKAYVNFGFAGLERVLGPVLKEKIKSVVEGALYQVKTILEKTNPSPPKFAFLIHSTDLNLYEGAFRDKPCPEHKKEILEKVFGWLPPFKASHIYGVQSLTGKIIEGDFIYSPLTPRQILNGNSKMVLDHMIEAGRMAQHLGARILGLGAYSAFVGRRGVQIAESLLIPVTTGTAFTIRASLDAFYKAAVTVGIDLKKAHIVAIGATGTLASVCLEILSSDLESITMVAQRLDKLKAFRETLLSKNRHLNISVSVDIQKAVKDADMILICTSTPDILVDVKDLKPGAVVCDVSQPHNVSQENAALRKDVLVIDGGVIRPPGDVRFNFYFGLPSAFAFACMAETMILTLEERFENYSLGGNVTAEKVQEIGVWGRKHGFELGGLKSFGRSITWEDLDRIKSLRK